MKPIIAPILILSASIALSSCSDSNFAEMCKVEAAKKISKEAEISITKKAITMQGLSATVTLDLTAVTRNKDKDDKLAYYKVSCIIKSDRVTRAFVRPAGG